MIFEDILLSDKPPLSYLVTPISSYYICHHFISTELDPASPTYIGMNLKVYANNLVKHRNYDTIKNMDIIQVQVDHLSFFQDEILPFLYNKNIKVILFTSQVHLPQIQRNERTDALLNHPSIHLWISQNPIYQHEKYMAFPYGIHHLDIENYVRHYTFCEKQRTILNQHVAVHPHLPANHVRRLYDVFGKGTGKKLPYETYLKNIAQSEFVISTGGDREDCHRHYECIGLGTIPVANINSIYKDIFEDNIIFSTPEQMIRMLETKQLPPYKPPNKDILTLSYWKNKIKERIKK
jgi:hypothetical protein